MFSLKSLLLPCMVITLFSNFCQFAYWSVSIEKVPKIWSLGSFISQTTVLHILRILPFPFLPSYRKLWGSHTDKLTLKPSWGWNILFRILTFKWFWETNYKVLEITNRSLSLEKNKPKQKLCGRSRPTLVDKPTHDHRRSVWWELFKMLPTM